ncbi:MAG: hypothetical protein EXS36_17580, partial [Pedosphaera sp.]|nr:hypothetical protein [Pedosphaera sp.]
MEYPILPPQAVARDNATGRKKIALQSGRVFPALGVAHGAPLLPMKADQLHSPFAGDKYLHFGFGSRRAKPKLQREFHRHNEIEFLLLESGGIDYLVGGKRLLLQPGKLTVFWGAIPHAPIGIKPDTIANRLTIPLPWFLSWQLPQ